MLWVVSGTGTGVGKTAVSTALVRMLRKRGPVTGWKPVETGVSGALGEDQSALAAESTFHVKHERHTCFPQPVSPHLAARLAGTELRPQVWSDYANELRALGQVVIELAGGLFTPLTETLLNIDFVLMLKPNRHVLVAPDRLGVLHDAIATVSGARCTLAAPDCILVNRLSSLSDSPTNATEIARFVPIPVLGPLAHAPIEERASALEEWFPAVAP